MKFEVGDKVRVKDLSEIDKNKHPGINEYMYHYSGKEAVITKVDSDLYGISIDKDEWSWSYEMLEYINDYITTKDFIKLVEDMGYELDIRTGVIFIKTKNFREVGWVRTDYECSAAFNFECDKLLLDIFYLYAKTPIEFREVKEYTLQCPLTGAYLCINSTTSGNTVWLHKNNFAVNKDGIPKYTQQEIDNLPNQELIKTLIQKEVEND